MVMVATLMVIAYLVAAAEAHYEAINYHTYNNCSERKVVDPINIVFVGKGTSAGAAATWQRASDIVKNEVGWEDQNTGSTQSILDHGGCREMNDQRKLGTRRGHHTRLFQMADRDRRNRVVTVGDAHQERIVRCGGRPGDAVYSSINGRTGFDEGAAEVMRAIGGQRYIGYVKRPERAQRETFAQCNGERVGWNGRQLFFTTDR